MPPSPPPALSFEEPNDLLRRLVRLIRLAGCTELRRDSTELRAPSTIVPCIAMRSGYMYNIIDEVPRGILRQSPSAGGAAKAISDSLFATGCKRISRDLIACEFQRSGYVTEIIAAPQTATLVVT